MLVVDVCITGYAQSPISVAFITPLHRRVGKLYTGGKAAIRVHFQ